MLASLSAKTLLKRSHSRRVYTTSGLEVKNPKNGSTITTIPVDSEASITKKVSSLKKAGIDQLKKLSVADRKKAMLKFASLLEQRKEELAKTLSSEMGKPVQQALSEVNATVTRTKWFIDNADSALAPQTVFDEGGMTEMIVREPLGVVANISAWNYPFFVGTNVLVPALLAGNAVLYKPSEFSSLTGTNIVEMLHQSGFDKSVQLVVGGGQVGAHILKSGINGVFFTGSYPTGKKIAEAVAGDMIKVQLELGGKDPVYVHSDVDVKNAAEGLADGAMYNTGQSCCSVERIYVHKSIGKQFIEEFVKTVDTFKTGDPLDKSTYIGPLTRAAQMDVLDAQVKDALAKGAKLLRGGKRVANSSGNYYEPTVLANVNNSMEVMKEESFGPIIGIQEVSSPEEATSLMNDTIYGLTAGVYAKDQQVATQVLSNVNSGTAYWNCCDRVSPRLPWSGRLHSGVGLTLSLEGITTFTQPKAYHLRK